MAAKKRIVLFDGNAVFHRGYHAIPGLSTKDGTPTNAVYGFTLMLLNSIRDLKPDYVVVAWDKSKKTFRNDLSPTYKANRAEMPDDLRQQIPLVKEVIDALAIPLVEVEDYEADDIIGTLAKQSSVQNLDTVIVTGDKDELQLIDHNTRVYTMRRGMTDTVIFDTAAMQETYGMTPAQFVDFKALKGDASDNIAGVPGIGEKTAMSLVQTHGSLEGIYEHLDELKPAVADKLRENKDQAMLSRKLATIVTDMPIKLDLDKSRWGEIDRDRAFELFQRFEFKSLLDKLPQPAKAKVPSLFDQAEATIEKPVDVDYEIVDTAEKLTKLVKLLEQQPVIAIDTETNSVDSITATLVGISISFKAKQSWYIPVGHQSGNQLKKDEIFRLLQPVLENPKIGKVGHNIKFDYEVFRTCGVELGPVVFDTMVAAFLLNPLRRSPGLSDLAFNELGLEMIPIERLIGTGRGQTTFDVTTIEDAHCYACEDADITWRLYEKLRPELKKTDRLQKVAETQEWPLIPVLAAMEIEGIKLDSVYLKELADVVGKRITKLEKDIWEMAGGSFNISSTQQLKAVLFDRLNLGSVGLKRVKSGVSTAASELEKLQGTHPIIDLIMEYRELTKLKSTYIDALPLLVDKNGRLHTSYNQTIAATGRLSSNNPNLQNIPVRTELGREIRKAFVAGAGKLLISADYSQFELRLAAVLADDQDMIETFNRGVDIHVETAAELFNVPEDKVTKDMRAAAKTVNFGVLYGMSPHGLSVATGMDHDTAKAFIDRYFGMRKQLLVYLESLREKAHKDGYVETLFGRRRPTPDVKSANFVVRQAAERAAINMPIQGTEADLMKLVMIQIGQEMDSDAKMLLQVHDSLIVEVSEKKAESVAAYLKDKMEKVHKFKVKLDVDTKIGKNWGEM